MVYKKLQRKKRKNILRSQNKNKIIKRLKETPILKNIDVEAIKLSFEERKSEKKV